MKTIIVFVVITMLAFSGISMACGNGNLCPAPNSGDGVSDGSGYDSPNGPSGNDTNDEGTKGPAPNSGDGVPDGSGF